MDSSRIKYFLGLEDKGNQPLTAEEKAEVVRCLLGNTGIRSLREFKPLNFFLKEENDYNRISDALIAGIQLSRNVHLQKVYRRFQWKNDIRTDCLIFLARNGYLVEWNARCVINQHPYVDFLDLSVARMDEKRLAEIFTPTEEVYLFDNPDPFKTILARIARIIRESIRSIETDLHYLIRFQEHIHGVGARSGLHFFEYD